MATDDAPSIERRRSTTVETARTLGDRCDDRTVDVDPTLDEDAFFSTADGDPTVTTRDDLERCVPAAKKPSFREIDRYWVNKPYAFVVLFDAETAHETHYYVVEPHLSPVESELRTFLSTRLTETIPYGDARVRDADGPEERTAVIEAELERLLRRYGLLGRRRGRETAGLLDRFRRLLPRLPSRIRSREHQSDRSRSNAGASADRCPLTDRQISTLQYYLVRDTVGYGRIDPIMRDDNVEDISCDGYREPVFVYHSGHEQIVSNVTHGADELDDFVVGLAQRSGNGISKRVPQVDATLPDGSRAQLTLGTEVADRGTNYTIRQFTDVPFTPIDLVNWHTFSLDQMAFLWLAIENGRSLLLAGGTASGKTTSLNAISLFIPSNAKVVSIEDTREVELPQRNWIASVTRPSFAADERGDVDEFDLLEAALRQRPEYLVMGETRGEEGRTLFQVTSTGHTTLTTFHADSVDEVLKRFTTAPIDVPKSMFAALDLVSIQTQTDLGGRTVRRNRSLTEINHYDPEHDEINVRDIYRWQPGADTFREIQGSNTLAAIRADRGWSEERLETSLFKRRVVLAYLLANDHRSYAAVATTIQAFMADSETILSLLADGTLEERFADLRTMESISIESSQGAESLVSRPSPGDRSLARAAELLEEADRSLFPRYRTEAGA